MITNDIYIFDSEVTKYDWLFVFKSVETGTYYVYHNDNDGVINFMETMNPFLGGFNNKHYDNHILKGVMSYLDPETIKEINDLIIVEGIDGWQIPYLRDRHIYFDSFDLMDDTQQGTSLKSFEAHYGMDIEETEVDFNIDRPWTEEETELMIHYCKADVDATEKLFELRKNYLENKITLGAKKGYEPRKCLGWTNAKLTSVYLDAKKPEKMWKDEREYHYPDKLLKKYVPQEVFDFFDTLKDLSIPREEVFTSSLEITIGGCPCTVAYGGIHGAIPNYVEEEEG